MSLGGCSMLMLLSCRQCKQLKARQAQADNALVSAKEHGTRIYGIPGEVHDMGMVVIMTCQRYLLEYASGSQSAHNLSSILWHWESPQLEHWDQYFKVRQVVEALGHDETARSPVTRGQRSCLTRGAVDILQGWQLMANHRSWQSVLGGPSKRAVIWDLHHRSHAVQASYWILWK